MRFTNQNIHGVSVLQLLETKLDTSNSGLFKGEFSSFIKNGQIHKLVLDLSGIEQCDSSGLSSLLVINRLVQENEGYIRLIPSSKIHQLFQVTKLDQVLAISMNLEEAIGELQKIKD